MKRLHLGLKLGVVALVLLGLVNPTVEAEAQARCRFYLIDLSNSYQTVKDSRGSDWDGRILEMIAHDVRKLSSADQASIVGFGRRAVVGLPPRPVQTFRPMDKEGLAVLTEAADPTRSNLSGALEACRTSLPEGMIGEAVLFTDTRHSDSEVQIRAAAAAAGMEVYVVPVGVREPRDVRIVSVGFPPPAGPSDLVPLRVTIASTVAGQAVVTAQDRRLEVELVAGAVRTLRFEGVRPRADAITVKATIEGDICPGNDSVRLDVPVQDEKPRVLLITAGDSRLPEVLGGAYAVETVSEFRPPHDYAVVILENIRGNQIKPVDMKTLQAYVEEFGGGLVIIGGDEAYGGEYSGTPIEEVSPLWARPDIDRTIVFVLDRSGTMSNDFKGRPRIDIMKRSVILASEVLGPEDWVAVVSIPEEGQPVLPPTRLGDGAEFARAVESMKPDGPTPVIDSLMEARRILMEAGTLVKHIVLVTDGDTEEPKEAIEKIGRDLKGLRLSGTLVVTAERHNLSALDWTTLSAANLDRLDESIKQALKLGGGSYASGVTVKPGPPNWINGGVPSFPLARINRTTPRQHGFVMMETEEGHPVAAFRPARTGGCVALTLGAGGWVGDQWEPVSRVIRNAVKHLAANRATPIHIQTVPGGDRLKIRVAAGRDVGSIGSVRAHFQYLRDKTMRGEGRLARIGPNLFEGSLDANRPGTYLIDLQELRGRGYATWIYGAELEAVGVDPGRVNWLASLEGWEVIANFTRFSARPVSRAATVRRPLRTPLLGLALALFLLQMLIEAFYRR